MTASCGPELPEGQSLDLNPRTFVPDPQALTTKDSLPAGIGTGDFFIFFASLSDANL